MKREGDYIKHAPPTLKYVESFSFFNIHLLVYSLCLYTLCLYSLSHRHIHTHTHTHTHHLFCCTESLHDSLHSYMELRPGEPTFENKKQILLGPDCLRLMVVNFINIPRDSSLLDAIEEHMASDELVKDVLDHIFSYQASCS